jgi:hypothetical protein
MTARSGRIVAASGLAQAALLRGAGLFLVWLQLAALAVIRAPLLAGSLARFHPTTGAMA